MINRRQVVKVDDIVILENALWETVDQKDNVRLTYLSKYTCYIDYPLR
nr:hypothetical protein [Sporosarcina sp. 6E9]